MITAEDMERIALEVLRRLAAKTPPVPPAEQELCMDDKVITLSSIEGRLHGIRRLVLEPRAVVTPSVRDELRSRGIDLTRRSGKRPTTSTCTRLLVAHEEAVPVAAALPNAVAMAAEFLPAASLADAIAKLAGQLHDGGQGLVVTREPEKAVWLASRSPRVRAFCAHDESQVRRAWKTFAANVLVLDERLSPSSLAVVNAFRALPRERS